MLPRVHITVTRSQGAPEDTVWDPNPAGTQLWGHPGASYPSAGDSDEKSPGAQVDPKFRSSRDRMGVPKVGHRWPEGGTE